MTTLEQDTRRLRARIANVLMPVIGTKPSLARSLAKLDIVASTKVNTLATDGYSIFVNMECADSLSDSELVASLEHELLHVVFEHNVLRGLLDPNNARGSRFNIAADCEINSHVVGLPEWVVTPAQYGLRDGLGTRYYWVNLPDDDDDPSDDDNSDGNPSDGNPSAGDHSDHVIAPPADMPGTSALSDDDVKAIEKDYSLSGSSTVQAIRNEMFNRDIVNALLRMIRNKNTTVFTRQAQSRNDRQFFGRVVTKPRPRPYALYLDRSGSMVDYWPYFKSLADQVSDRDVAFIGLFDTVLQPYRDCSFGGGTDMAPVAKHAKDNNFIPIVFTDGFYGHVNMPDDTIYVLTEDHSDYTDYGNKKYVLRHTPNGLA